MKIGETFTQKDEEGIIKQGITICAWCPDKDKRDKECYDSGYDIISHGICDSCNKSFCNKDGN